MAHSDIAFTTRLADAHRVRALVYSTVSFFVTVTISALVIVFDMSESEYVKEIANSLPEGFKYIKDYAGEFIVVVLIIHHCRIFFGVTFLDGDTSFLKTKRDIFGTEDPRVVDITLLVIHLIIVLLLPVMYVSCPHYATGILLSVQVIAIFWFNVYYREVLWRDEQRKWNVVIVLEDLIYAILIAFFLISPLTNTQHFIGTGPLEIFMIIACGIFILLFAGEMLGQYISSAVNTFQEIVGGIKRLKFQQSNAKA